MRGLDLLGQKVRDRVTGLEGVVTTISYDLYGCVQAIVTPKAKEGETRSSAWFDTHRLVVLNEKRVMPLPDFGEVKGPAEKPIR